MEPKAPPPPAADTQPALPFAYANRHGVLLAQGGDVPTLLHKPAVQARTLAEMQRLFGARLRLQALPADAFEDALRRA